MLSKLLNVVLFQIGWFACVLGAAHDRPWLGPLAALPIVGAYLWQEQDRMNALRMVLSVGFLGTVVDSALGYIGVLVFRDSPLALWLCPPWLIALWLIFSTTLRPSLSWLAGRPGLAALLGGIFGPVSYCAGATLGALSLDGDVVLGLVILVIFWAVLLPLLVGWANHDKAVFSGRQPV